MIVSDFDHRTKQFRDESETRKNQYSTNLVALHEPGYQNNVSIRRLWSHFVWGYHVMHYLKNTQKPDLVYCAIPSLTAARYAAKYCKNNHIPFFVDVQDLWPEAFAMVIKSKWLQCLFLPMRWYVNQAYTSADVAIAVSKSYVNRVLSVNKKLVSGISVYIGNDGSIFDMELDKCHKERDKEEIVLGYVGGLSASYDIPCVCDALSKVSERGRVNSRITFVIIGSGVYENSYKSYANNVYPNTTFLGLKPYHEMVELLYDFDIVINPITNGSVASIINKVGDYAMAGKPVINTQESVEYRQLVETYHCGINCRCGNADDVADAIEKLVLDEELRKEMGANAKRLGSERFDRRYTYRSIIEAIEQRVVVKDV